MIDGLVYDVVIIGGGPAGLTASIYSKRSQLETLVFAGNSPGGQLMLTTLVENFPGFPGGIQGPELMSRMREQSIQLGVKIVDQVVEKISRVDGYFQVLDYSNVGFKARSIILAMGADHKWLGVEGEDKFIGKGVSTCAPCDAYFFRKKRVFVVGGGDTAMEEVKILSKFANEVVLLHRRGDFRAVKANVDEALSKENVKFLMNSQVVECLGYSKLSELIIKTKIDYYDFDSVSDIVISLGGVEFHRDAEYVFWRVLTDGLFVAIGHVPNSGFLQDFVQLSKDGYVESVRNGNIKLIKSISGSMVEASRFGVYNMMTSVEGVFVAGDIGDSQYKQAITAASLGCMASMDCDKWLSSLDASNNSA